MALKVGLETVVGVVPNTVVKAEDQAYLEPVIPDVLKGRMRFPKEIRRLRNNDAIEIMALEAAKKALDKAGLKPSDIDYIIANNCGGKYAVPMVGGYIHWKLGFPQEVTAMNIQTACASFVDGCEIAWNLVLSGKYKRVLIVVAAAWETSGGGGRTDFTDPMFSVMGDGAGAAVVSSQNLKCEFLSHYNRTFGEVYDLSGADVRSPAHPDLKGAPPQPQFAVYGYGTPEFFMWWQKVGERFGIDGINGALMRANLTLDDLDLVIFHQPADLLYDTWIEGAEKFGLRKDKWKHTWDQYGNMANSVVPVNLAEFWQKGMLKENMVMAWITIGAGGHAPTMIVRWLV